MRQKLRSQQGETLVEVLACILIASLSVSMLFGGVVASLHINEAADLRDEDYYQIFTAAEAQTNQLPKPAGGSYTVKIENRGIGKEEPLDIHLYGGEGAVSYALDKGDGS